MLGTRRPAVSMRSIFVQRESPNPSTFSAPLVPSCKGYLSIHPQSHPSLMRSSSTLLQKQYRANGTPRLNQCNPLTPSQTPNTYGASSRPRNQRTRTNNSVTEDHPETSTKRASFINAPSLAEPEPAVHRLPELKSPPPFPSIVSTAGRDSATDFKSRPLCRRTRSVPAEDGSTGSNKDGGEGKAVGGDEGGVWDGDCGIRM